MHRGYIKIWRKIKDSGLMQMHGTLATFIYLLTEATHQKIRKGMIDLERGQSSFGRHDLAKDLKLSEQQLRTCIKRLVDLNMVSVKSTSRCSVYTIVNYDNYQAIDNLSTSEQPTINQRATNYQPASNH